MTKLDDEFGYVVAHITDIPITRREDGRYIGIDEELANKMLVERIKKTFCINTVVAIPPYDPMSIIPSRNYHWLPSDKETQRIVEGIISDILELDRNYKTVCDNCPEFSKEKLCEDCKVNISIDLEDLLVPVCQVLYLLSLDQSFSISELAEEFFQEMLSSSDVAQKIAYWAVNRITNPSTDGEDRNASATILGLLHPASVADNDFWLTDLGKFLSSPFESTERAQDFTGPSAL